MDQTELFWDFPQDDKLLMELLLPFYSQLWVSREWVHVRVILVLWGGCGVRPRGCAR